MKEKTVSFLDAAGHRAVIECEITERNGYPEFTASGTYLSAGGQCLDEIKPATEKQKELIGLWTKYHLKDVSKIHNFRENLEGILSVIEYEEKERVAAAKKTQGDERLLELMAEQGIDESEIDACRAYMRVMSEIDLLNFQEAYSGQYESDEDFAREQADQSGALENIENNATWPHNHIDWTAAAEDLMQDYTEQDGYYFRNL